MHGNFALLVACAALAACASGVPACRYQVPEQAAEGSAPGRLNNDPSSLPMLPYNPYWIGTDPSLPIVGSPADPCAGEPFHPGRLPP